MNENKYFYEIKYYLFYFNTAVPRILELKMQKKFYWCISYKIAGYPRPEKSWLFNSNPLNLSESIQDFEVSSKSFFVYEGKLPYSYSCIDKIFRFNYIT